ncbi:hypothetical protein HYT23_00215 [Candidatus Pacearchaeota archaeon]|nr:hypothetical protein [Candidatus Pacearchaeota archaeon]
MNNKIKPMLINYIVGFLSIFLATIILLNLIINTGKLIIAFMGIVIFVYIY